MKKSNIYGVMFAIIVAVTMYSVSSANSYASDAVAPSVNESGTVLIPAVIRIYDGRSYKYDGVMTDDDDLVTACGYKSKPIKPLLKVPIVRAV